ncbi:MAG: Gfo/Idh/MocA family oxidoreductase [Chloroflexi bacterium]|nr:Gfo/Idh/MocA family oxidoreductase [Chloroflexota bacterium]
MTERILRWGLLSTARINRALIPPLRASTRNQLLAVASRTPERAQAYAREWRIPRAFGSYEALLADPEIDVIYNSLPNGLHAEWTIRAAQAGKHVLCEKPLALTLAEVDAMAAAARAAGVVVAEAFMYRHHPQTLRVLELVRGATRCTGTFERVSRDSGGGPVVHFSDAGGTEKMLRTRAVIGAEPLEAFGWQVSGPSGVDETFVGQLRFPGEVFAQFDCGFRAPFRTHLEIVGSEATLTVPNPFKPGQRERLSLRRGDMEEILTAPGGELYLGEVEDMADAVLRGRAPRVSLADSRGNVAAILALLRSARAGRLVAVGEA